MLTSIIAGIPPCGCSPMPSTLTWTGGVSAAVCGLPTSISLSAVTTLPYPFHSTLGVFTGSSVLPYALPGASNWYASAAYPSSGPGCDTRISFIWAVGISGTGCGCIIQPVLALYMNDGTDYTSGGINTMRKGIIQDNPFAFISSSNPDNTCDPFSVTKGWLRGTSSCPSCSITG